MRRRPNNGSLVSAEEVIEIGDVGAHRVFGVLSSVKFFLIRDDLIFKFDIVVDLVTRPLTDSIIKILLVNYLN